MKLCDISHWQGDVDFAKYPYSALIVKATQGRYFTDPKLNRNKIEARRRKILLGFYHFADGTNPEEEAEFFLKKVGEIKKGEFLALDWEIQHKKPVTWCKRFLDQVRIMVGFKPMIYLNAYTAGAFDWSPVIKADYGLWIAHYKSIGKPKIGKWSFYALWQYTSKARVSGIKGNADLNYTKMDLETLKKYGKQ